MDHAVTGEPIRFGALSSPIRLGGTVRGRVVLSPDLAGVDAITVALVFETAGKCDPEQGVLREATVRRSGPDRTVDFILDGPLWPPTYQGHLFTGRWYLRARAGAAQVQTELVVEAEHGPVDVQPLQREPQARSRPVAARVRRLVLLALAEAACVAVMVIGLVRGDAYWPLGLIGVLLLPALIGALLGLMSVRAAGELSVDVQPTEVGLAVRARLGDPSRVASLTATLVGRELAQRGVGYDHPEYREHVLYEQPVPMAQTPDGAFETTVPIPPHPRVPFTMSHSCAQVGWSLRVHAAITGAPDQTRSVALAFRPRVRSGAAEPPPLRWTTG